MRIELSYLLKHQFFVRGKDVARSLSWNRNGKPSGDIYVVSHWSKKDTPTLNLMYKTTDRETGEVEQRNDTIYLESVPSNLGKGEVLYFLCPESGQRCRILYRAYDSRIWKSREAYKNRLYYTGQKCSKLDLFNTRYWELDDVIKKIHKERVVETYRGRITRRFARLQELEFKKKCADHMRWSPAGMTLRIRRAIFDENGNVKPC
ncbi:hypothetical protein J2I47_16765 [Fibrella sp. HMF5335]|uniref:Uncharacterized protein n=1 Tax=Fibrella rubiginis TaxID=2817060 RepID=A0A939GKP7_9BACT|nr:hypothetical protein [Fibrella rubiginis]MBO0938207.1 hypothetical protein [Fibrella rubiginis]